MIVEDLPPELAELAKCVVDILKDVYDDNCSRFDPELGDDRMTFGTAVWRNSWFQIEQACHTLPDWSAARPSGSFVISNGNHSLHIYHHGVDERVDLGDFHLGEEAGYTKAAIAKMNSRQLRLFESAENEDPPAVSVLHELVIVHAGNPDDGCCGIWVGAPLASGLTVDSPWAWISPLWTIDREPELPTDKRHGDYVEHDRLPEPELDIRPNDFREQTGSDRE